MAQHIDVMVSSTKENLKAHRGVIREVIERLGMYPLIMENMPASDADAIDKSLEYVDNAEVFVGVLAYRYGYVPNDPIRNPDRLSITELEYRRAVERKIPRLFFFMDKTHPITAEEMQENSGSDDEDLRRQKRLRDLKKEIGDVNADGTGRVVEFFTSPEQLARQVAIALTPYRDKSQPEKDLNPPSDIPAPPAPYIAHPYTLRSAEEIVGRQVELNRLTDWIAKPGSPDYGARIFNLVAIGGMGKSAVTWKWFQQVLPNERPDLKGRLWWSFYESDARFENFVIRALAYAGGMAREQVEKLPPPEREERLINLLRHAPYLLVLDGLERILIAYARLDAARMVDGDLDAQTGNRGEAGDHKLRKTADPRAGQFLRKLAAEGSQTRVLVTTRLYPADLELRWDKPLAGCARLDLKGLTDDDAVNLWRGQDVTGTRDMLVGLFNQFDNYPLLITALAGEIAEDPRAVGVFDLWLEDHPRFVPDLEMLTDTDRHAHVLKVALEGLSDREKTVLSTLAAFRMPASYTTLAALLVKPTRSTTSVSPVVVFEQEADLIAALRSLGDRGLIGWDNRRGANRYDLHPIVRAVAWGGLAANGRAEIFDALQKHFEEIVRRTNNAGSSLGELIPAIELFYVYVQRSYFNDAMNLFRKTIDEPTLFNFSASQLRISLLEGLYTDISLKQLSPDNLALFFNALGLAYQFSGRPIDALTILRKHLEVRKLTDRKDAIIVSYANLSMIHTILGQFFEADVMAQKAYNLARNIRSDYHMASVMTYQGYCLGFIGRRSKSRTLLVKSNELTRKLMKRGQVRLQNIAAVEWRRAEIELIEKHYGAARRRIVELVDYLDQLHSPRDRVAILRRLGTLDLAEDKTDEAYTNLSEALIGARAINFVEEELPALTGLAELARRRGDLEGARELLDQVWDGAERGPYPLLHADALNALAQVERDAGNPEAAIQAASEAYRKAWCDGISADGKTCYAYWYGLQGAKAHLDALGAAYPVLPPFDESKYEAMVDEPVDPL